MQITHAKTVSIADWTQSDLDDAIALGQFPPGTLLADIQLPSDWNEAHIVTGALEILDAAREYWVRSDGSDSNDGLTDAAEGAFLTLEKALSTAKLIYTNGYSIDINVRTGAYATPSTTDFPFAESGKLTINGYGDVPADVSVDNPISISSGFLGLYYIAAPQAVVGGNSASSRVQECALNDLQVSNGAYAFAINNTYASSGAPVSCASLGRIDLSGGTATAGSVTSFALCQSGGLIQASGAFTGTPTGPQYLVKSGGIITASGATLPGDTAGTEETGGLYVP